MANEEKKVRGTETHEGFTVGLALVDALPVIFFGGSLTVIATALSGTGLTFALVVIGAVLVVLSGFCKVSWKMCLGLGIGDIQILNKMFVPAMATGFMITVSGVVVGTIKKVIKWNLVLASVLSAPVIICFLIGFTGMGLMSYYRKSNDKETFDHDAKKNWIAQITNGIAQGMFFLGILLAKFN